MARRTGFYLNKRDGKFLGVCSGIADYTGFDVLWVRAAMLLGAVFGGGITVVLYFVIALLASPKPVEFYDVDPEDRQFWQKTRAAPARSIRDIRSTFRDVDRRLADIERAYTSPQNRLSREIDALR